MSSLHNQFALVPTPHTDITNLNTFGSITAASTNGLGTIGDHVIAVTNTFESFQWTAVAKNIVSNDAVGIPFTMSSGNGGEIRVSVNAGFSGTYQTSWTIQGFSPIVAVQSLSFGGLAGGVGDVITYCIRQENSLDASNYIIPSRIDTLAVSDTVVPRYRSSQLSTMNIRSLVFNYQKLSD